MSGGQGMARSLTLPALIRTFTTTMGAEQRRQHRLPVALEVRIRGTDAAGIRFEETVFSHDISRGGCSLEISRELEVGAELEVEILRHVPGPAGAIPFETQGVVLRSVPAARANGARASGDEVYSVAMQFTGPHFPTYTSEETDSPQGQT